jgi:hypothetical protein
MPSSYELICQYVRSSGKVINLCRVIRSGALPMSYRHAKRLVKQGEIQGELRVQRQAGQGRPLCLEANDRD